MADYQQNFLGALQGGLDFGQQVKRQRDQSALGQLASQAYGAAPEQRTSLLGQMATISPQAAQAQQNAWDGDEDRRNKSMVNMARLLTSAPEEARPGLWRSFVPTLSQYGLSELPPEYNEQTAPIITKAAEALAQSYGGQESGSAALSTYVDDQGRRVAVMRDGSTRVLGGADLGMSQQTITVQGPDGRPQQMTFDKRSGQYLPAGFGTGGAREVPFAIDPSLPPEVQAQIRESEASGQPVPQQMTFQQSAPFVGQSPAERAAAEASARRQVELSTLPAELGMRTQAAVEQAGGVEAAKITAEKRAERLATLPQTVATADQTIDLLNRIKNHQGRGAATGASSLSPLNRIPGTAAYDFNVLLDQIKGQAFLQAFQSLKGGGAITEREGQAATNAIARLNAAQSEQEFLRSIDDLITIVNDGRQRAIQSASQGEGQSPPQSLPNSPSAPRVRRFNPATGRLE